MDGFCKNALCPGMHRSKNALHPMGQIADKDAFFCKSCVFLYKNVVKI